MEPIYSKDVLEVVRIILNCLRQLQKLNNKIGEKIILYMMMITKIKYAKTKNTKLKSSL